MNQLDETKNEELRQGFLSILITDVSSAFERHRISDCQATRRDAIRCIFAAVEGLVWVYREHVLDVARDMELLTTAEEHAFAENGYTVSREGRINKQPRFVPVESTFRLATRIALKISPELVIRFDTGGWTAFGDAIKIRNRLMHPKTKFDLRVEVEDFKSCYTGFKWLLEACLHVMESANKAMIRDIANLSAVFEELRSGDSDTLALYEELKQNQTD